MVKDSGANVPNELSTGIRPLQCLRTIGLARARVVIGLKVAMHNLLLMARLAHLEIGAPA